MFKECEQHVRLCVMMYKYQMQHGRNFAHEHPHTNSSWGAERFFCVKVFQPSFTGKKRGFHDTSFHNLVKCDVDIRKVVVLSGGT